MTFGKAKINFKIVKANLLMQACYYHINVTRIFKSKTNTVQFLLVSRLKLKLLPFMCK